MLVVRGEDGELRAFRNVCRHRAARLRDGRGDCGKAIRCPYHGWTYRTDGSLIGVPEGRGFAGLDKRELGLLPARVDTFCGLVFVNLDLDAAPVSQGLDGLAERLAPYRLPQLRRFDEAHTAQPANWKIVAENYLEGYHVPIAHPGLMRLLDYQRYTVEVGEGYVFFEAPLREKPSGNRLERAYQRLVQPDAGAHRRRPPRLALHLHLAKHDDGPLPRPGHDLADLARRAARHRGRLRLLPRRRAVARRCARCSSSITA